MNHFGAYFAGKNILVTGAAGALGKGLTKSLYNFNANVTAVSRNKLKLEKLKEELPKLETICLDLKDWDATRKRLDQIEAPFDGIINNAGVASTETIMQTTPEILKSTIDVNVLGTINTTQALVPKMIKAGKEGSIVNISSLTSVRGTNLFASYSVSKSALNVVTQLMAVELGKHGIRVNALCPFGFESEMMLEAAKKLFGGEKGMQRRNDKTVRRIPLAKPLLQVDEVVNATLFVLSGAVPMLTGHPLVIDGGFTLT